MWIVTRDGFYSIAASNADSRYVQVRSRDYESLHRLMRLAWPAINEATIQQAVDYESGTDYEYRVEMPAHVLGSVLANEIKTIRYQKFKPEVLESRGQHWYNVLIRAWSVLLDLNPRPGWKYMKKSAVPVDVLPYHHGGGASHEGNGGRGGLGTSHGPDRMGGGPSQAGRRGRARRRVAGGRRKGPRASRD